MIIAILLNFELKCFKKTKLSIIFAIILHPQSVALDKIFNKGQSMQYFETIFLEEADEFIFTLDDKIQRKVFYNIRIAEQTNDPELFKKLTDDIWEFRTLYAKKHIRILAFWDKADKTNILVLAVSGFIKKTKKTPLKEIEKAKHIRSRYFEEKETGVK